jgi:E3 ubiquitin-protein ligase RNF14
LSKLAKNLDDLWDKNANCPILFSWIYFLMEESIEFLDLNNKIIKIENENQIDGSSEIDKRVFKDQCFVEIMRDYDKDEREIKFHNAYHTCNVCFEEKSGFEMLEFIGCNHAYCNRCMKDYFEIQIKDGNVNSLTCPFNNCETQALPLQVNIHLKSFLVF